MLINKSGNSQSQKQDLSGVNVNNCICKIVKTPQRTTTNYNLLNIYFIENLLNLGRFIPNKKMLLVQVGRNLNEI